jgi:polyhydroxybutyrate depolymerase
MAAGVDDVGFLTTVLHQVLASGAGADPTRVYLVGYSNGGKMALTLACADPRAFAGVGVYGATAVAPCPTPGAVSLIEVASTGDPELTIGPTGTPKTAGTFVQPTVTGEVATYRGADGCTATSSTAGAGAFTQTTWATCSGGRKVALGRYQGGSHSWPAGGGATPSGAQVLWSFFRSLGA